MGETYSESVSAPSATFRDEITASKLIAFIAIFFMFANAIDIIDNVDLGLLEDINILYAVIEIILAIVIFISLDFVDLKKFKIPYFWWLLLVFGVIEVIFAFLVELENYMPGMLVLLAAVIELLSSKDWEPSRIVALLGAAFGIYDCIIVFLSADHLLFRDIYIANAVFGIIFAILLILTLQDMIDIRVPFNWWVLATVALIFFFWVSPIAAVFGPLYDTYLTLSGVAWMVLFLAFALLAFGF